MSENVTRRLVVASTAVGAILAGGNFHRYALEVPAFRRVGMEAWGAYSRNADLGPLARFLYPIEGIGGAALAVAAAISFLRGGRKPRRAAPAIYAAAALTIGGMLATTRAAPVMLGVRHLGNDPAALQKAFDEFHRWGAIRGVCQILAFAATLRSLTALLGSD